MNYYQEAKAHFLASHQHPINQFLHHLVNLMAIAAIITLFLDWRITAILLVLTQVFAIGGHIVFEKNEPAFKKYPGIVILVSLSWSFENWFGLRQLLKNKS
ncbi:MAG: DUF962 domain-containing protein [Okeania sp. SIO2H7]|nr:DUF962 domain-containing protein [Okeania sp. SIO2H7]